MRSNFHHPKRFFFKSCPFGINKHFITEIFQIAVTLGTSISKSFLFVITKFNVYDIFSHLATATTTAANNDLAFGLVSNVIDICNYQLVKNQLVPRVTEKVIKV